MIRRLLRGVALPAEVTPFERRYLARMNRLALWVLAAHLPVLCGVAALNDGDVAEAAWLSIAALVGPWLAHRTGPDARRTSVVIGVGAVLLAGILVHVGRGPMQIEMHFHFFVVLASLAVFGNPKVILAAGGSIALHHLALWLTFPRGVFNYDAAAWVVAVHAAFISLESIAACFIARSFFDDVIGLEKIVEERTRALSERRRDLQHLLDNVDQGFLSIDEQGHPSVERSRAIDAWLAAPRAGESWWDLLDRVDPAFAARSRVGWDAVREDLLPLELNLAQMPRRLRAGPRTLDVEYRVADGEAGQRRFLVVISDVTERLGREASDARRREELELLSALLDDRTGTRALLEEASRWIGDASRASAALEEQRRALHTVKGNVAMAGLRELSSRVHRLEDALMEAAAPVDLSELQATLERLLRLTDGLGGGAGRSRDVDATRLDALEAALLGGASRAELLERVRHFRKEPLGPRLHRLAEHARALARQLERDVEVESHDGHVAVDPEAWSPVLANLVHAVRNAVGHGVEPASERVARGKPPRGRIWLRARAAGEAVVVEVEDDGRGVDLGAVATRALAMGLPATSTEDLLAALLRDGMSTRREADEIGGRGVGLASLRAAVEGLGGRLSVSSTVGHGTRIRVEVPRSRGAARGPGLSAIAGGGAGTSPALAGR